jgi:pentatricopeptide repeat protein
MDLFVFVSTPTEAYCDSVLALCVASDEWDSVLEVLEVKKRQGLTQERSSYRACLLACFDIGNGGAAKEILIAMDRALVTPEPSDISLVVAAMCRNEKSEAGWWRRALSLLKATSANKTSIDMSVVPVEAYDAVLSCMVEERQWKESVRLLRLMEEGSDPTKRKDTGLHPKPQLSTYRSVIECCVSAQEAEPAVQVLLSMKNRGLKVCVFCVSIPADFVSLAVSDSLFLCHVQSAVPFILYQPTVYAFELVISALSKKLQWRRALQLLDVMDELQIPKTVVTYNTVISACARAREVGTAKSLLVKMRKEGIKPNVLSFNSVISACASTSRWKDALAVLDQMHREPGVTPDIYTYTNAMRYVTVVTVGDKYNKTCFNLFHLFLIRNRRACAKGGKTSRALTLLQVAKDKGLPVDSYCYTAVIDGKKLESNQCLFVFLVLTCHFVCWYSLCKVKKVGESIRTTRGDAETGDCTDRSDL